MKHIINGREYICNTPNPHGALREILINAQMHGAKIEIVKE